MAWKLAAGVLLYFFLATAYARKAKEKYMYHGKIITVMREHKAEGGRSIGSGKKSAVSGKKRYFCGGSCSPACAPSCASTCCIAQPIAVPINPINGMLPVLPMCGGGGCGPPPNPSFQLPAGGQTALIVPLPIASAVSAGGVAISGPMGPPGPPGPVGPMGPAGSPGAPPGSLGALSSGFTSVPGIPPMCPSLCAHWWTIVSSSRPPPPTSTCPSQCQLTQCCSPPAIGPPGSCNLQCAPGCCTPSSAYYYASAPPAPPSTSPSSTSVPICQPGCANQGCCNPSSASSCQPYCAPACCVSGKK